MNRNTGQSKRNAQDGSTHLPPLQNNQSELRAHFFDNNGERLSKASSRRFASNNNDELQTTS